MAAVPLVNVLGVLLGAEELLDLGRQRVGVAGVADLEISPGGHTADKRESGRSLEEWTVQARGQGHGPSHQGL